MSVVANFTFTVTSGSIGVAPFTVAFTDTSTGSPNAWRWNFGDGYHSTAKNPTHTFTANGLPTVRLTAFIQTASSVVNGAFVSGRKKTGTGGNPTAAFNNFTAASWATVSLPSTSIIRYSLTFVTGYILTGEEAKFSYNLGSEVGQYSELQVFFATAPNPPGTKVNTDLGDKIDPVFTGVWLPVREVTANLGTTIEVNYFGDNYIFGGWDYTSTGTQVITYTAVDIDYIDTILQPLQADFYGVPLFGSNLQSVNFFDLSDPVTTTWSWRKRKAGTTDTFIEFATTKNPSHVFDRDNP